MQQKAKLVPGRVAPEQFDLLLEGTSIRGPEIIEALRDHFVNGITQSDAAKKYLVHKTQLSRRAKVLQKESERACALSPYYTGATPRPSAE